MPRLIACLVLCLASLSVMAEAIPPAPELAAKSWVMIDADSGHIIAESNADMRVDPASLTKMMTSYILSYELAQGRVKNSDMVTVSENAWAKTLTGSSLMFIKVGDRVSLEDLHRGIIISSGNDASIAVAEHLGGSVEGFANIMNQHAQRLGMTHTHFMNPHGLTDPDHYTTAHDMATMARAIIRDFPGDYELYKEKEFTYNNIHQPNRNLLLWSDPTVDGLKTGHTDAAGYCLVASAKRDGMRLITAVMGTASDKARAAETEKLLTYGFRFFETVHKFSKGEVLNKAEVWSGKSRELTLGVSDDVFITVPRGEAEHLQVTMTVDELIHAPVKAGDVKGKVEVRLGDQVVQELPLVALNDIEQAGWFGRFWDAIRLFFHNLFSKHHG